MNLYLNLAYISYKLLLLCIMRNMKNGKVRRK